MTPLEIITAALVEAGEDPSGVHVWDVNPKDKLLRMNGVDRVAMALIDGDDREIIAFDRTYPGNMESELQHEAAHLVAWRRHGMGIKEHGPEFVKICRQLVKRQPMKYCKKE